MSPKAKPLPTETELLDILAKRFAPPAWSFLRQVADGTGGNKRRTADALAMSLWPSAGLDLYGFEIKRDRADLKRELEDPGKSDAIARFCRYWYLVVADAKIMESLSVPKAWGILSYQGRRGLVEIHKPSPLEDVKTLDPPMIAAILRKVQEQKSPESVIGDAVTKAVREESGRYSRLMTKERELAHKDGERQRDFNAAALRVLGVNVNTFGWREKMETLEELLGPILNPLGKKKMWYDDELPSATEARKWATKQLDNMVKAGERVVEAATKARERLENGSTEQRERTPAGAKDSTDSTG